MNPFPLPDHVGVGFSIPPGAVHADMFGQNPRGLPRRYRAEQVPHDAGRSYHNFHFTNTDWEWPEAAPEPPRGLVFDAFSPNLNKYLHVGHLRNLALATSMSRIFRDGDNAQFVSLLGVSLGIADGAMAKLDEWFGFLEFWPRLFTDLGALTSGTVPVRQGDGEQAGCEVWDGPKGPVIVRRSDGRPTYAMHDLMFAKLVKPDKYLTGAEQKEHFESIGFGDRHLPMGLVLDPATGKKMKSRDGNALDAEDAVALVVENLDKTPEPRKLAWNVLAWNFLHSARTTPVRFDVEKWTSPDSQGMYVTYTHARIASAIRKGKAAGSWLPNLAFPAKGLDPILHPDDVGLLGFASYMDFHLKRAIETFDPAPIANHAAALAKRLGAAYHGEHISAGRPGLQFAIETAHDTLGEEMRLLGMFVLRSV